jgi:hypothetical protein
LTFLLLALLQLLALLVLLFVHVLEFLLVLLLELLLVRILIWRSIRGPGRRRPIAVLALVVCRRIIRCRIICRTIIRLLVILRPIGLYILLRAVVLWPLVVLLSIHLLVLSGRVGAVGGRPLIIRWLVRRLILSGIVRPLHGGAPIISFGVLRRCRLRRRRNSYSALPRVVCVFLANL